MPKNPMVLEHYQCLGELGGQRVSISPLNAIGATLTSVGSGQLLIPVPDDSIRDQVKAAISSVTKERRRLVRVVDEKGRMLAKVRDYLTPLHDQAKEWPESAFIDTVLRTLYKAAIGTKYEAHVVDSDIGTSLSFIPIIRPSRFQGEARYRLAELCSTLTQFEAAPMERLQLVGMPLNDYSRKAIPEILASAEFNGVISEMGRLGYLRHPWMSLGRLKEKVGSVAKNERFKRAVKTTASASELPVSPVHFGALGDLADSGSARRRFTPVMIDLPITTRYQIYTEALREYDQRTTSLRGAIYMVETSLGVHQWLSKGEESKISYDYKDAVSRLNKASERARKALLRPK